MQNYLYRKLCTSIRFFMLFCEWIQEGFESTSRLCLICSPMSLVLLFMTVFFIGSACLSCSAASVQETVQLDKLLNRIEKRYAGRDFSLDFRQISTLKAINVVDKAYGKAFFRYPGKMRWEYKSPEKNEIITDGENLWIYRPDEHQVVKGKAGDLFVTGSGGAFLSDISMIDKFYRLSIEKQNTSSVNILMIPKKKVPDIASIHIRVLKADGEINRIITSNIYGDTTELDFSNIKFIHLRDFLFRFVVPAGTDILFMNK